MLSFHLHLDCGGNRKLPEGLQEENETALRNSVEFGGDECDGKANLLK